MKELLFVICAYSLASILVEQGIFKEPREWLKSCVADNSNWLLRKFCALIRCMWCAGVWCGFILCWMGFNIVDINHWDFFFCGLISGFTTYLIHQFMLRLDIYLKEFGIES